MRLELNEVPEFIKSCLKDLSKRRPVFHSEADFQHALAIALSEKAKKNDILLRVRLEKKLGHNNKEKNYIDIVLIFEKLIVAIELKYKTKGVKIIDSDGEEYALLNQGAQDIGNHAFFKDVEDLENLQRENKIDMGICIFLTNEKYYWENHEREIIFKQFKINNGREVCEECLNWVKTSRIDPKEKGWIRKYPEIKIQGSYKLNWEDYSDKNFKFLFLEIN